MGMIENTIKEHVKKGMESLSSMQDQHFEKMMPKAAVLPIERQKEGEISIHEKSSLIFKPS